jgi:UDP-N-acetylmuramate: L-alanyl-gamma-D-glutamyl-meso-diaminopimelate ligase
VFVLEGDEYPSANWDARSKFLHYNPRNVLLTSATHDHINVYPTHDEYLKPFRELMAVLPHDGIVVVNDEPFAREVAQGYSGARIAYGLSPHNEWHAANIAYGKHTTFDLMHKNEKVIALSTKLLGAHNVENIVGISAMLLEKNLLTPSELAAAVAEFEGVKRRMELLSPNSAVPVFEGFGSSYEKARAALAAMKLHFPTRRLLIIIEPHTFTWRNRKALSQYDTAFEGADKVFIYEPATQGAATHAQLTQEEIVAQVQAAGVDAQAIHDETDTLALLRSELQATDCVLLLTSGDLGGLIKSVPTLCDELFPA